MHYQIHLNNIKLPMLVEADTMEHIANMLVLYKASTAVAAISLMELQCVIEVEASSVPPKDVFLDLQSDNVTLQADLKNTRLQNNKLWEQRREALDAKEDAERALQAAELKMSKLSGTFLCTLAAIAIVAIVKIYWS